jgi:hypothetical protein
MRASPKTLRGWWFSDGKMLLTTSDMVLTPFGDEVDGFFPEGCACVALGEAAQLVLGGLDDPEAFELNVIARGRTGGADSCSWSYT